ncbi:MAG: GAF domain-containing protein [Phycisphaerae bacterium]|nr:GAF domain-containing protein [Phycisphaerae bacterium]
MTNNQQSLSILSFLANTHAKDLCQALNYSEKEITILGTDNSCDIEDMTSEIFWQHFALENINAIVIPFDSHKLYELSDYIKANPQTTGKLGFWSWLNCAVIAVLTEDSMQDAIVAAELDFDGIISMPTDGQDIEGLLESSIKRSSSRHQISSRYSKLQGLLREVNKNRHHLQDKVDLLCKDLVQTNRDFTSSLLDVRKAYEFQQSLVGQFDMHYTLHKGLGDIICSIEDASAALYLTRSGDFEAHALGAWQEQYQDMTDIEEIFGKTIISETLTKSDMMLFSGQTVIDLTSEDLSNHQENLLGNLSIMTVPLMDNGQPVAIITIYRDSQKPLTSNEFKAIKPIIQPFAKTIKSLLKLENLLL